MAARDDVLRILLELLAEIFGQFPIPPLNPDKRATEEIGDDQRFEVAIPVASGKVNFAAEERNTETVFRVALSEEAVAAGLFEKALEWAEAAERKVKERFLKTEKRIKIAIVEISAAGDVRTRHILTIDARRR